MKHKTLTESRRYRTFVEDRNRALEQILTNTQTDLSRMLFETLDQISGFVSHMALTREMNLTQLNYLSSQLDHYLHVQFARLIDPMHKRIKRMRRATYTLTYLGELEAIARATKKTTPALSLGTFRFKKDEQMNSKTINDEKWDHRIWSALWGIKSDILESFNSAIIQELSPYEILKRVKKSYPTLTDYKKTPRALKKLKESDADERDKKEFEFYQGLTNDEDWDLAVQAYKDTELPASRFEQGAGFDEDTGSRRYNWEIEQDLTDDFVKQVRDGQVEAGNNLGIKDFVWVAIIDKKTCETCCIPRNGHTTTEIKRMLSTGELDKNECDATNSPAHNFCRCDMAPVGETDEVEGPDWKSFDDWLAS